MSLSQIITDRVVPVLTALTLVGVLGLVGLFVSKGHVGGAVSVGALAVLLGVVVAHDVKRLLLK
jgi:membrane-bound ClpP family serine protease